MNRDTNKSDASFQDLEVWQEAHRLCIEIYKISKLFPKDETYGLTSQIRRAAVSVELNIAESYGRYHYAEEVNFLFNSRGSIYEIQSGLLISRDLKMVSPQKAGILIDEYQVLAKRINSLINYKKNRRKR